MLDIRGEFSKVEAEFVSVCRLIERLQLISRHESPSGEVTVPEICTWLMKQINENSTFVPTLMNLTNIYTIEPTFPKGTVEDEIDWLKKKLITIINMKHLPIKNDEEPDTDDWFDKSLYATGFLKSDIENFIPQLVKNMEFTFQEKSSQLNVLSMESKYTATPDVSSLDTKDILEQSCEWSNFKGKDTALMMIAGLAISLSKSSGGLMIGDKINVSAIARAAAKSINQFGAGVDVSDRALENLVRDALKHHDSKFSNS
ncbi:hypothetical protein HV271_04085 [Citrobacter freundii]|uniref:hypothetical protein n=1 Tax=Citrobacter freundii TaxID=546 RepID=UPI0015EB092D|nr:hypothetical protein [Citrobacter freundii]QLX24041.1 hypothetical protein HV271_04085 [Citrobacter freundii]